MNSYSDKNTSKTDSDSWHNLGDAKGVDALAYLLQHDMDALINYAANGTKQFATGHDNKTSMKTVNKND